MKSDLSKGMPPDFSNEPGPPHTQYVNPPTQYTQHYKAALTLQGFKNIQLFGILVASHTTGESY